MKSKNFKCLACYEILPGDIDQEYHEKCSKKIFGNSRAPALDYDFSQIEDLARQALENRLAIPGVQPKLSLAIEKQNQKSEKKSRLTIIGLWDGMYVLKPANKSYPELPENEDLTMHLAELCGIQTATHSLVRFRSGELAYICKRFDRVTKRKKTEKLPQEDLCQLTGLLTENKFNSSMEKVATTTSKHTTNKGLEAVKLFEVTVFSFLTGNSDMHLKNFSLLKNLDDTIQLSPAYDLVSTRIVVPKDREEMALTLNGRKNKLTKDDFFAFAKHCKIPEKAAANSMANFAEKLSDMRAFIRKSFLSKEMQENYLVLLKERASRLELKAQP
jgi:serine/threonine-protein kinase HipA